MEILKTKIAIIGSRLMVLRNSEIEVLTNRARYRIELSKCINGKQPLVDGQT